MRKFLADLALARSDYLYICATNSTGERRLRYAIKSARWFRLSVSLRGLEVAR